MREKTTNKDMTMSNGTQENSGKTGKGSKSTLSDLLSSCPFCGGSRLLSLYEVSVPANPLFGLWRVGCGSCRIATYRQTKEEAVSFWNERKPVEPLPFDYFIEEL